MALSSPKPQACSSSVPMKIQKRSWSDIPSELLSSIADRMGLFELLCVRGVCRHWRSAASTASAQVESAPSAKPYFLLHTTDGNCIFFDQSEKKTYSINIPELKETAFLASNQGWLLLFQEQQGSVFFFCPFSRARIDLPKFPHAQVSDHVAAFSAPPTSPDCVVAIINRSDKSELELNVLSRGADTWTTHEFSHHEDKFGPVSGASHRDGSFHFVDCKRRGLIFSVDEKRFEPYQISDNGQGEPLPYSYCRWYSLYRDLRRALKVDDDASIAACGAVLPLHSLDFIIFNQNLPGNSIGSAERKFKGVWIQPRVYQIPPNQSWSL